MVIPTSTGAVLELLAVNHKRRSLYLHYSQLLANYILRRKKKSVIKQPMGVLERSRLSALPTHWDCLKKKQNRDIGLWRLEAKSPVRWSQAPFSGLPC